MAALDFTDAPSVNDTFPLTDPRWRWDGTTWNSIGVTGSVGINAQTGTTYTLVATDNGKIVTLNNASAITLTVPSGLGAGFCCMLVQLNTGQVTVTPSSTTVNGYSSATKLAGQYAAGTLVAYAANVFDFSGNIAT